MRDFLTAVGAAFVVLFIIGFIIGAIDGWRVYKRERRAYDKIMARRHARFYENQAELILDVEDATARRLHEQRVGARFN